ncbi:MAG TPA: TonB-dependent receptor, partial [Puia sp.]|nr:TonB-dependent receptor [Puia sp.]
FKNFLFVHGSVRNDWNSLLSKANRSYLYPAVDFSFVFSDAIPGLQNNRVLSFGKIRGAYSKTAQVSIGAYSLQNTFNAGGGFPFGSIAGFSVNPTSANPDIKPEFSTDEELGLELGFLNNRINFSAAVYKTITNNQTVPITISSTTGFTKAYVNSGEMSNKGIELDLKVTPIQTKDLRWDVGVNYSYNKNVLLALGYGQTDVPIPNSNSHAIIGSPYPVLKMNDWLRDPQGRIIVDANTGYPSLDPQLKVFGTTNPPTKVGINTSLSFKGFTLAAVADGRFGAVIYNGIGPDLDFTGVSAYSAQSGRQPFVIPNSSYFDPNKNIYIANTKINTQDGNNLFWANVWNTANSNYINSADFWKLRELALSYTFPKTMLGRQKIVNGLTIGVEGRNLIVIKPKDNVWSDPEFANTTGNGTGTTNINQLPPTKWYGFNLRVTF